MKFFTSAPTRFNLLAAAGEALERLLLRWASISRVPTVGETAVLGAAAIGGGGAVTLEGEFVTCCAVASSTDVLASMRAVITNVFLYIGFISQRAHLFCQHRNQSLQWCI